VVIVCRSGILGERLRRQIAAEAGAHYRQRLVSADGIEMHVAVNQLAGFGLTTALLGQLRVNGPAGFTPFEAYARAKLLTTMTGYLLADRLQETGVTVNAVHPGLVATPIVDVVVPPLMRPFLGLIKRSLLTPAPGAAAALRLATAPELADVTGRYLRWFEPACLAVTAPAQPPPARTAR
jgi:NAD(P)-dependent dehydrogenase (short-subunit alcohol dehydrogenase family)